MSYVAIKSHILNKYIIPSKFFFKMLTADNIRIAVSYLKGTLYYEDLIENLNNSEKIKEIIESIFLDKILRFVKWTNINKFGVVRKYLERYVANYLIALLKSIFYGKVQFFTTKQLELIQKLLPKIDTEKISTYKFYDILKILKRNELLHGKIHHLIELSRRLKNPLPIEIAVWKAYYEKLIRNDEVSKSLILLDYINTEIDIKNLYNSILLNGMDISKNVLSIFFIEGGKLISKETFIKITEVTEERFTELVPRKYANLVKYYVKGLISALFYEENELLYSIISRAKIEEPTSAAYSLYIIKKIELERYDIELILNAFLFNLDKKIVKKLIIPY